MIIIREKREKLPLFGNIEMIEIIKQIMNTTEKTPFLYLSANNFQ